MSVYLIETWQDENGLWFAASNFYRVEAQRGYSESEAVDAIVGTVYAALAYRQQPPREVKFDIRRKGKRDD